MIPYELFQKLCFPGKNILQRKFLRLFLSLFKLYGINASFLEKIFRLLFRFSSNSFHLFELLVHDGKICLHLLKPLIIQGKQFFFIEFVQKRLVFIRQFPAFEEKLLVMLHRKGVLLQIF